MRVYIGAAIDASGNPGQRYKDLVQLVTEALPEDVVIFNPFTAYANVSQCDRTTTDSEYIKEINDFALDNADLGVFIWSDDPSFGVPLEIHRRVAKQQHCIVWYRSQKKMGVYLEVLNGNEYCHVDPDRTEVIEAIRAYAIENFKGSINFNKERKSTHVSAINS